MDQTRTQRRAKVSTWVANIGLLLILASLVVPLINFGSKAFMYIYSVGAAVTLVGRLFAVVPEGLSMRVRRLCRLELWAAVLFCAGVFCLYYKGLQLTDWLAFTLAGGLLQGYASIAVPRAIEREQRASGEDKNVKK